MPEFLVETYVARDGGDSVAQAGERARQATLELAKEGVTVGYVRSIYVPDDETCFFLYEAETIDAVRVAARLAELPFDRVTEAVTGPALVGRQE